MEINRQYKDRLFRLLFGKEDCRDNILSLYNALQGTDYTNAGDIELTTIEDAIYIGMKNDVSFIIDDHMPLWEQQSTYNPNMPVRGLMYYGKLYDAYMAKEHRQIYSSSLIKLPTPQYIVFYNGNTKRPLYEQMRLSDAFFDNDVKDMYEWTADVYNLNCRENNDLLEACKPLADYSELVRRINERWHRGMTKEEAQKAVDEAVASCIRDGILVDFLTKHRAEVVDVCLTEFDEKAYAETLLEDGRKIGLEEGRAAILDALRALSSGKSEEYLREKGFDEETIISAKKFLEDSGKII